MINRPKKCTNMGEYKCQVPMPINGRSHGIDLCIADIVSALNASNLTTEASCCGHGRQPGIISLADDRHMVVFDDMREAIDCVGNYKKGLTT